MKKIVCLIGIGEMGGVLGRGLLKIGYPVYPITRAMDLSQSDRDIPDPEVVVAAVGEKDLPDCLKNLPSTWYDRVVLLQNELLPRDWLSHQIRNPTVISAWFEKKRPMDYKVIIPSPLFGPKAQLIEQALRALDIPCQMLKSEEELVFELVAKNLYILTINIAGLQVGGTVEELWKKYQTLARDITNDILDIQFWLIGKNFKREQLIGKMAEAFAGDWQHKCLGRTGWERLQRAISYADQAGLPVKKLREIHSHQRKTTLSHQK